MKTNQYNILAMGRSTYSLLVSSPVQVSSVPGLPAATEALDAELGRITTFAATQAEPLPAALAAREASLRDLTLTTLTIAGAVRSHAMASKRASLAIRVRVNPSDFDRARLPARVLMASHVHDAIVPIVDELSDLGITPATLTAFAEKIEQSNQAIIAVRHTEIAKKVATMQLVEAFCSLHAFLTNRLDPLVYPLSETNREFYASYRAARKIVHRRGSRGKDGTGGTGDETALSLTPATESPRQAA